MMQKFKLTVAELFNNQDARIIFILGILLIAALAGGAPHEYSGGG